MRGVPYGDPDCITSCAKLEEYINKVGFLPLFANGIKGFSSEEHTAPNSWWCDIPEKDPWIWREEIARGGRIAYGKFFGGRAGYISLEWLPYLPTGAGTDTILTVFTTTERHSCALRR